MENRIQAGLLPNSGYRALLTCLILLPNLIQIRACLPIALSQLPACDTLIDVANVFDTVVASSLMDKQGRKSLLITSFSGMAASMLLLSLSSTWIVLAPYSGSLAVIGTVLYVLSISLGAGPVPALLLPEIFASITRAKAISLSLGTHWISNFFIGIYFLSVVNKFGISSQHPGFSIVCVLDVLHIAGNIVETKGRSLEEIECALSPAV